MTEFINMFKNYANFKDRTNKRGFWMAFLFTVLILVVVNIVLGFMGNFGTWVAGIIDLALAIPTLAIMVRRLRDAGKPIWYVLFAVVPGLLAWIPFVGWIISPASLVVIIVFLVQDSVPDDGTPVV